MFSRKSAKLEMVLGENSKIAGDVESVGTISLHDERCGVEWHMPHGGGKYGARCRYGQKCG